MASIFANSSIEIDLNRTDRPISNLALIESVLRETTDPGIRPMICHPPEFPGIDGSLVFGNRD